MHYIVWCVDMYYAEIQCSRWWIIVKWHMMDCLNKREYHSQNKIENENVLQTVYTNFFLCFHRFVINKE